MKKPSLPKMTPPPNPATMAESRTSTPFSGSTPTMPNVLTGPQGTPRAGTRRRLLLGGDSGSRS